MVNSIIKCLFFCIFFVTGYKANANELGCEFRPIYLNVKPGKHPYELGSASMNSELRDRLLMILRYYGKDAKALGRSKLGISCDLYADLDFLVSVTKKSLDKKWLEEHKN
ncbi:hypothetical protein BTJ40_10785 [Microbulbifer sp. A4B17]|uniref:hypothetical protein n=1 Tax=Microbulbifer sp. A4B17 TaxID=359370 RepID=UPI000D52E2ED|nr:hypothetical protein [Microbulbifer sp. A4B17]AWF81265.1 hypothetical protein BTJ40_10785 [Microbulbifer sp. A4B17]